MGTGVLPSSAGTKKIPPHAKVIEGLVTAFTGAESFIGNVLSAGVYPAAASINAAGGNTRSPDGGRYRGHAR